eukprot:9182248-Pyramimonas_sp.AAC.1
MVRRGLRWEPYLEGEDLEWVRGMATGGAPMLFSAQPAPFWRQQGFVRDSCALDRMLAKIVQLILKRLIRVIVTRSFRGFHARR